MTDKAKLLPEVSDEALLAALEERMTSPEFTAKVVAAQGGRTRVEGALGRSADVTSTPTLSPELQAQLEAAEKLFGKDFMGPKQVEKAWGFAPSNVPSIPFSQERLASAQKLGMMLRLAVDKTPDGSPMTMKAMNTMQAESGRNPKVHYDTEWYQDEAFFEETPRTGWRLESKSVLKDSTNKNEVEQLEVIVRHLKHTIFAKDVMPAHYKEAIAQFEARKAQIATLMESEKDWPKASAMIEALDLCKLTRGTPVEMIQAIETQHQNDEDGAFLHSNAYVRTPRRISGGRLVNVGNVHADGASVSGSHPGSRDGDIGVALSLQS